MPEAPRKIYLQESCDQTLPAGSGIAPQTQERIAELEQALKFESTLRHIVETVQNFLEESDVFQTVVQELALLLEADCTICLYEAEQQEAVDCNCSALAWESAWETANWRTQIEDHLELRQQLQQGKYVQFCPTHSLHGQGTWFAFSLIKGDAFLGELWIARKTSSVFSQAEICLVQRVANQCAIAVHQSRLYQVAQKQVEESKNLNQAKDDFLSQVTHDLRSPLSNMRLSIQLLEHFLFNGRSQCGQVAQHNSACSKTLAHLKILQTECEREIALVNDLLDLQRLEFEHQSANTDSIHLTDWLKNLIQPFEECLRQRQLTLNLHVSPDLPTLISNSANLHRVLTELLHNACKYTPPHEIISFNVSTQLEQVQICVSNSGVQIAAEELPRIFEKFYRIPGSDRWKQGGTGLGLALVKQLVHHLRGAIQVESGNGQTYFTVKLPLRSVN